MNMIRRTLSRSVRNLVEKGGQSTVMLLPSKQSGIAATEFALLAPVMILLICGGIELGHFYLASMTLQGATLEAARAASAAQDQSASAREATVRARILAMMSQFRLQQGKHIDIQIRSHTSFENAATPEPFTDINANGRYDPPAFSAFAGEPFTDRNGNGQWDSSLARDSTVGGTGDVVSYTAAYPAAPLFDFLPMRALGDVILTATAVTRNEPVTTSGAGS